MEIYDSLNPQQQKAVFSKAKYIRVIAGAGSGKTRVLTLRMVHLIQDLNVRPYKICALTFTNKASLEMKDRLKLYIGEGGSGVWLSTIHSLCVRILREDINALDYPRNFTILDATDQRTVLKEAYREFNFDVKEISLNSAIDYISNMKGAEVSVKRAYEMAYKSDLDLKKAKLYEYYDNRLKKMYGLDFDDLLLFTVRLFKKHSAILQKWQQRHDHLLVDEFQDIDHLQYTLITQLVGTQNSLYVVGDPDQTIYTWRGADVNIILDFTKQFKPNETVYLTQNYRSTSNILKGANALISHNKYREEKDLFTELESDHRILHMTLNSQEEEANWIVSRVMEIEASGVPYNDIAVLYRSNYLSRAIEKALILNSIPYIIYGGLRFYDRAEIKDVLSYLRMLVVADDLSFLRTVNLPKRGLGPKAIDRLRAVSFEKQISLYEVAKNYNPFKGQQQASLAGYVALIEKLKVLSLEKTLDQLISDILDLSLLRQYYTEAHELDRVENVKELISDARSFMNMYPEANLDEYLQSVALYGDKSEIVEDALQLMTIHASKGLEFDHVFICGLSEGVFPNERSMSDGKRGLEEERRLAYVAMTRAKKRLYLSDSQGFSFVLNKGQVTSRFINEIDEEVIDHQQMGYYGQIEQKPSATEVNNYLRAGQTGQKQIRYAKGDVVIHTTFGEGIVIRLDDGVADIAFNHPYGLKTIVVNHPALSKKEKQYDA
ncbi:MAG TPA: UvrD-helicase domain-containing protein [Erysipelothrix sp.]|nr:UvrD-helicase domain-containing protein [Erysipelothrix sp.]